MPLTLVRHRFTVDDYEQMIDAGILTEDDRVELIRAEILSRMAIGDQHSAWVKRLNRLMGKAVGDQALVSVQDPIRLTDSEPEPDLALLVPRTDYYASGKPRSADVMLVIEVADTSLDYDRDVKRPLYAENSIREFWLVNLTDECVDVCRKPSSEGTYGDVPILRRGQMVEIETVPGISLSIDNLL